MLIDINALPTDPTAPFPYASDALHVITYEDYSGVEHINVVRPIAGQDDIEMRHIRGRGYKITRAFTVSRAELLAIYEQQLNGD